MDKDNSGTLSFDEVCAYIASDGGVSEEDAKSLMKQYDLDGDGVDDDEEEDAAPQEVLLGAPSGAMSFADAQRSFLYPYKHESAPKPRRETMAVI